MVIIGRNDRRLKVISVLLSATSRAGGPFRYALRAVSEHRIHHPLADAAAGGQLTITGDEAQHAVRVKRVEAGSTVGIFDGAGRVATARVTRIGKDQRSREWSLTLAVERVRAEPAPAPRLEVWSAVPKGGRLEDMIDGLSQAGVAAWAPLRSSRSVAEPTGHKLDRLARIVIESAKQCGRAWLMEVGEGGDVSAAFEHAGVIIADASGPPYGPGAVPARARLLVGPEGGWTAQELEAARAAGATVASFGPHVMRIETAAVAAAAIVLDQLRRRSS